MLVSPHISVAKDMRIIWPTRGFRPLSRNCPAKSGLFFGLFPLALTHRSMDYDR